MTDRRDDHDDEQDAARPPAPRPAEGVRILGAEEAQAALEAGSVGRRLGEGETRFGDVPPRPDPTLRPAVRFPRVADDEAPSIAAAESADERAPGRSPGPDKGVSPVEAGAEPETIRPRRAGEPSGEPTRSPETRPPEPRPPETRPPESSGPVPLPHWTEPPTGEIPQILPEAQVGDVTAEHEAASPTGSVRFRTEPLDWDDEPLLETLGDEDASLGALAEAPEDDDAAFEREVAARRRIRPPDRSPRDRRPDATHAAAQTDLATRLLVAVPIVVVALICLRLGRDATAALATVIVLLASFELFQAFQQRGFRPATILGVTGSAVILPIAYLRNDPEFAFPFVVVMVTVFSLLWYLFEVVRARPVVNVAITLLGVVYVGGLGGFAGLLLSDRHGVGLLLGVAICAVGYDVVGYFVGSQFGRNRLAPTISPSKTWEGLIGGMAAAFVLALVVVHQITPWNHLGDAFALGLTTALMAPLGDLCESMIKRDLQLKDFGAILPGHGGVLDRFDAILFCLPAVYYLARALKVG